MELNTFFEKLWNINLKEKKNYTKQALIQAKTNLKNILETKIWL